MAFLVHSACAVRAGEFARYGSPLCVFTAARVRLPYPGLRESSNRLTAFFGRIDKRSFRCRGNGWTIECPDCPSLFSVTTETPALPHEIPAGARRSADAP